MSQVFNPFLPLYEYIPDGEPHIFGDRVYLFGSHDKEGGETFCMLDYAVYSAPINDLKNWRYEGIIYHANQDPLYTKELCYMYAPDVVQGNDGKYYLYYCLSGKFGKGGYQGVISVAVCDSPAGRYRYLGFVKNPDGSPMKSYICFDPAVMNDNGIIRLYYGTSYPYEEEPDFRENQERIQEECDMFGKTEEEILNTPDSVMGAIGCTLEDDMLTIKEPPKHIIPYATKNTSFEEHPFFEASSMRKVGKKYYFIYSSLQNHELCYATSDYPDKDFTFGGTIVSNGDIGYGGRTPERRLNMTGTTHGSIIQIQNQWYVFYHRLTHKSDYSRQACAERIQILPDGSIPQVEITSCGLNGTPLETSGTYPAVIACNITNGHMPHGSNKIFTERFPNVTNLNNERFIGEISDNTLIGYKYFKFEKNQKNIRLRLRYRGNAEGMFKIYTDEECAVADGEIQISPVKFWTDVTIPLSHVSNNTFPLFIEFFGTGEAELLEFEFSSDSYNPEEHTDKSSFFMALCLVAGAGVFLAGASFLGRILNPEENPKKLETTTIIEYTKPSETEIYFPPSATETESYGKTQKTSETTVKPTEKFSYSSGRAGYESGEYAVGTDIPAGTYIAVSDNAHTMYGEFVFGVYDKPYQESSNMHSLNQNVHHQNSYYIELEDGQYIHFSHSKLYPFSESSQVLDPYAYSGMFKVYHDNLEAGVYTLIADGDYSGTYAVYGDIHANAEPIDWGYLEEGETAEVTLGETDYLMTDFCHIIEESYPEGTYLVGTDIPEGLYVAVNNYKTDRFLLEVYDKNNEVIAGGYTENNRYVYLNKDDKIVLTEATLYNAKYTRKFSQIYGLPGMYWIGHDIPEGVYIVQSFSGGKNQFAIYDENLNLTSAESVNDQKTVTLHDGEFIDMKNCYLSPLK